MSNNVLAEALLRVEFKLDLILSLLQVKPTMPMSFDGHMCPVCKATVQYQIDIAKQVVVRKCMCSSGKVIIDIQIMPDAPKPQSQSDGSPNLENLLPDILKLTKG